jgi:Protein of unknown function DUF262
MMKATGTNQKISWFHREDIAKNLNLAPAFQRKPVWTSEMSAYLIDSILNGLPIPEVYVRSTSTPEGQTTHEVVDGQQRIRAILNFARNDLVLNGSDDLKISPKWLGRSFENLSNGEKQAFWGYEVVVRDLGVATDGEIRDLFRRLNINQMPLTDQEIRHATYTGKFIKLMEAIADDAWWLESKIVTVRQVRRMEDVEFVSELFVAMVAGPQNKKDTLDSYYEDYESEMPEGEAWQTQFLAAQSMLTSVLEQDDVRAWSGRSDFYSLFLAFVELSKKRSKLVPAKRTSVREALMRFRKSVDAAKKRDAKPATGDLAAYVEAVTRAASDLSRRTARLDILERVIAKAL